MAASMFAQACDALVRERDRVFLERVAKDYNLSFEELSTKYLECSEAAIKVPRKYTKKAKVVTVETADGETTAKPVKPVAEKQCCTAHTSKKEPCKFSALKGEVFCKRHLRASLGEPAEPKAPKAKKAAKPEQPVHSHPVDQEATEPCDVCTKYGKPLEAPPTEFETVEQRLADLNKKACLKVIELKGESDELKEHLAYCEEEVERTKPKPLTAAQRLAAMLAAEDSDSESDADSTILEPEAYEDD
jgi:hypothetical protein